MKKSFIILGLLSVLSLGFISCAKQEHASNQRITVYPSIEIIGGTTYAHQVGTPWVEPGYVATLAGEDVTANVIVSDEVDADISGVYTQTYSYTNKDGFTSSESRTVVVYDIANAGDADIAGVYSNGWTRTDKSFAGPKDKKISVGPAKGLFYVQDLLCGFYQDYYGYGSAYAFKGLILLNKDNSISILTTEDPAWGYPIKDNGGSNYNTGTGEVTLNWFWGGWAKDISTVYTPKN